MNRAFDWVHTLNITYRTAQNINNVQAMRESTYEIRVDGQVFVGVYEEENVTNICLENRKQSIAHRTRKEIKSSVYLPLYRRMHKQHCYKYDSTVAFHCLYRCACQSFPA